MPFHVVENAAGCPADRPWGARRVGESRNFGCHPTRAKALAQVRALYANKADMQDFNELVVQAHEAALETEQRLAGIYAEAFMATGKKAAESLRAQSVQAAGFTAPSEQEMLVPLSEKQREEARKAHEEAADKLDEFLLIPLGLTFLSAAILARLNQQAAEAIDEAALTQLRLTVQQGLDAGLSVGEVAAAILEAFQGESVTTATMLARTQITALTNEASLQAARGVADTADKVVYKQWITMHDPKVRPAHARAEGQTRPLNAPFDIGGSSLMYPGDPSGPLALTANCRCVLTYTRSLPLTAAGSTLPGGESMTNVLSELARDSRRLADRFQVVWIEDEWTVRKERLGTLTAAGSGGPEWTANLVTANSPTPDGRMVAPDSLDHRDLPLPLMALFGTGPGGHQGAQLAARIDSIEQDGDNYIGSGVVDAGGEAGAELIRLRAAGMPLGVSVDLAIADKEFRAKSDPFGPALEEMDALEAFASGDALLVITKATILGATVVPMQAINEANSIEILASDGEGLPYIVRASGGFLNGEFGTLQNGPAFAPLTLNAGTPSTYTITASASYTKPSDEFFENPNLKEPTPMQYDTATGRIWGHLAPWDCCHVGFTVCTPPPQSPSGYAYFHTGMLETAEGGFLPVGKLMFSMDGGKHASADPNLGWREAAEHYDDSTKVAGYVRAGEDAHGIWHAGVLKPGLDPEVIQHLRLHPPSGDWRPIRGGSELIASFCVAVGGYPMPQSRLLLTASAGADDQLGTLIITPGWIEEEIPESELTLLIRVLHARAHGVEALAELAHEEVDHV